MSRIQADIYSIIKDSNVLASYTQPLHSSVLLSNKSTLYNHGYIHINCLNHDMAARIFRALHNRTIADQNVVLAWATPRPAQYQYRPYEHHDHGGQSAGAKKRSGWLGDGEGEAQISWEEGSEERHRHHGRTNKFGEELETTPQYLEPEPEFELPPDFESELELELEHDVDDHDNDNESASASESESEEEHPDDEEAEEPEDDIDDEGEDDDVDVEDAAARRVVQRAMRDMELSSISHSHTHGQEANVDVDVDVDGDVDGDGDADVHEGENDANPEQIDEHMSTPTTSSSHTAMRTAARTRPTL